MREAHAFRGHALEPGSRVACAAVRRKAFISEVVGHDEDDIRHSGGWRAGPGSGQENLQGEPAKPAPCPRRSLDEPPPEAEDGAYRCRKVPHQPCDQSTPPSREPLATQWEQPAVPPRNRIPSPRLARACTLARPGRVGVPVTLTSKHGPSLSARRVALSASVTVLEAVALSSFQDRPWPVRRNRDAVPELEGSASKRGKEFGADVQGGLGGEAAREAAVDCEARGVGCGWGVDQHPLDGEGGPGEVEGVVGEAARGVSASRSKLTVATIEPKRFSAAVGVADQTSVWAWAAAGFGGDQITADNFDSSSQG